MPIVRRTIAERAGKSIGFGRRLIDDGATVDDVDEPPQVGTFCDRSQPEGDGRRLAEPGWDIDTGRRRAGDPRGGAPASRTATAL
jgi:hypothetical protein